MIEHPVYRVTKVSIVSPYELSLQFDDGLVREINFRPVLEGELFGPLQDTSLFNRVFLDPEVHTIVWPNGADFDPATLHDWPQHVTVLSAMARKWAMTTTSSVTHQTGLSSQQNVSSPAIATERASLYFC